MIYLFQKLKQEKLIEPGDKVLDLGGGNGKFIEPFVDFGCVVTLIDKDRDVLYKTEEFFKLKNTNIEIIHESLENFEFKNKYKGITISNVLPFIQDKEKVAEIIEKSFENLDDGGFLFFTLFGEQDEWQKLHKDMSFWSKNDALNIMKKKPYYFSEDIGLGGTMSGELKDWHIFSFLYIK